MKILMVTGGTGGHIYPALALADYIKEHKGYPVTFIGNEDRMEATLIPEKGYAFYGLKTSGLAGSIVKKGKAVFQSLRAINKAKAILKKENPDVIIAFGGYVSLPVCIAAKKLKKKVILHEQNSIAGKANKMASRYADCVIICYENARKDFPDNKVLLLGNPRATLASKHAFNQASFDALGLDSSKPLGLIVMGSLGSSSVAHKLKEILPNIQDVNFLYVAGKNNIESAQELVADNVKVVDYVDQLAIIDAFDFVICRAGATTAAELAASGTLSILIPSPFVANNHQYYNAKAMVDDGYAFMIEEKDVDEKHLQDYIETYICKPDLAKKMKEAAIAHGFQDACQNIVEVIEKI
ncbi:MULTISPECIES: undecaprenyldiphospho-muramoylpentapeptide beta-N-acetylglucosaminyltransferase [unclassified Breznakia]|uniref:undecaprenyldiphospho-muramoylpentapeptide beta-N-acetylglucosaminyltransferase n=1 Tax=unclassified Breznakia TaxID=2623764 RepID=UPI002472EC78|nr:MULTISPECIES: undecaprenyldiphospho-muramoylpentapeptide beta-N-acetylglucosaminyltransferase [unclassified Breznakia]MDH6367104.1 UDP-N-acetylglucosamine--N-acetylmuramyl-(pentapeptide) pyrophosphoryl-undecaprenol N-acetylglucosamine transferase [Breznakia sp. PH1-1]MDH6404309.1 UDP-N-acetylglucosamine--N-acetylmuramyl-(pentapeptide) pyrophosphoryl-undecaprenol N-acetylglucosamine transferase [Breznakia sp. PF1-11]MDH6411991.1 UDP-N-acetylglucosamine--N-acetylmuramyl-(pentapeptide) pyrophosp